MAKYITPGKLLTMGLGGDLADLGDVEIEALCAQASTLADAYCNAPRLPQVHDFKGGQIVDEIHGWQYPVSPFDLGQRRVYVMHRPLVSVDYLRIYVSNQPLYLEINPANLVLNPTQNYMEIVALALTTSGVFNALIVPNVGLLAPIVKLGYRYGYRFDISGETLLETDGQTFRAENQFWYTTPAPKVYLNGTEQTSGITINSTEGTVVFDTPPSASDVVTADYSHHLPNDFMHGVGYLASFLRSGTSLRSKGLDRLSSIRVAEVALATRPMLRVEDIDQMVPEAALYLAAYRADSLVAR